MASDLDGDNALMMAIAQNHLEIDAWMNECERGAPFQG